MCEYAQDENVVELNIYMVGTYSESWTGQCEKVVFLTIATVVELNFPFSSLELKVMKIDRGSTP